MGAKDRLRSSMSFCWCRGWNGRISSLGKALGCKQPQAGLVEFRTSKGR